MPPRKFDHKDQLKLFDFSNGERPAIRSLEGGSQEQLSGFEMNLRRTLKSSLDKAAKRELLPLSRSDIAAGMSEALGREITKAQIDQWVAMSMIQRRIHTDSLKALCDVIDDYAPMHVFVEACGFKALHPDEAAAAEYGAKMLVKRMLDTDLKKTLKGINENNLRKQLISRMKGGRS